ncbi:MAG: PIN domain-containing protein [Micrococcales bacterium]|nr:PIN domain-containing protein [Micrococcales bacterium]
MIYLDSCVLIYLVERTPKLSLLIEQMMASEQPERFAISPLVQMECLVGPLRDDDKYRQAAFRRVFTRLVELPITREVFQAATLLRAQQNLRTPDAIHLATARHGKCTGLWTNDDRFAAAAQGFATSIRKP